MMTNAEKVEIQGVDVTPCEDSFVLPDQWSIGARLVECDWEAAPFRLPSVLHDQAPAVKVEVTGRSLRWDNPFTMTPAVRVRVTFVGDGEPDEVSGGWMMVGI